jgi:hypothetical protein
VLRVFNNPAKILQWILPSTTELKRVLFLCLSAHLLNAHLVEYLLTEHPTVLFSPVHPVHLLNALLAELSESLVILTSVELTTEFFFYALLALAQCPPGRDFTELKEILSATVFPLHNLASKVFL